MACSVYTQVYSSGCILYSARANVQMVKTGLLEVKSISSKVSI